MSDACFYRASGPSIDAYLEERERRFEEYKAAASALGEEFPGYDVAILKYSNGMRQVIGLTGEGCPGPDWQKRAGEDYWSPKRRSQAQKALAARFDAVLFRMPSTPGMPADVFSRDSMMSYTCGHHLIGNTLWVFWSAPPEVVEADIEFDRDIWDRAKASEYYLAKEAAEEGALL